VPLIDDITFFVNVSDFGEVSRRGKGEQTSATIQVILSLWLWGAERIICAICQLDVLVILYLSEAIESHT
jgi:LSD1 subclass zinc finger protein